MILNGNAHVYGDAVNTDVIIAGKYTKTLNMQDLAAHCLEDLDPDFRKKVKTGDFVVAGMNFGCGSSREQAPLALKYAGVGAVLAKSFARIFYRNAVNVGLPVIVCDTEEIQPGDTLSINFQAGKIAVNGIKTIYFEQLPPFMQAILSHNGLVEFLKNNGDFDYS